MNELGDKIAMYLYQDNGSDAKSMRMAIEILVLVNAQPSGLIAERECNNCSKEKRGKVLILGFTPDYLDCSECNATGTITRDLSVKEALEWARGIAKIYEKLHDEKLDGFAYLSGGERVVTK